MSLAITEPPNVCVGQVCTLGSGQEFTLAVELVSVPVGGYILAQSWIEFGTDLSYEATIAAADEMVWPECAASVLVRVFQPTYADHGCLTGVLSTPVSTYVGLFIELSFQCSTFASSSEVRLLPDGDPGALTSGALYLDAQGVRRVPEVEGLTVNCLDISLGTSTPTPTVDPSFTDTPSPTVTDTPEPGVTLTPDDVASPTPTPTPATTVTATTPTSTPTPATTVTATTPTSTPTLVVNEQGTPIPVSTSTGTPASQLTGDASCDGTVDPLDAALILQFAAGLTTALACPNAADASGDGIVDPLDAALILQFSAGLIGALTL